MNLERLSRAKLVTDISSFSNQTAYGITWFMRGERTKKTKDYLETGTKLCTVLIEGSRAALAEKISFSQLQYLDIVRPLKEEKIDLKEMVDGAAKVLEILNLMLENKTPTSEDIEFANSFFQNLSEVCLRISSKTLHPSGIGGCNYAY